MITKVIYKKKPKYYSKKGHLRSHKIEKAKRKCTEAVCVFDKNVFNTLDKRDIVAVLRENPQKYIVVTGTWRSNPPQSNEKPDIDYSIVQYHSVSSPSVIPFKEFRSCIAVIPCRFFSEKLQKMLCKPYQEVGIRLMIHELQKTI